MKHSLILAAILAGFLAGCAPLTHPVPPVKMFNQDPAALGLNIYVTNRPSQVFALSRPPASVDIHAQLHALRLSHHGLNWDQWPAADRAEFDRILKLETTN